MNQSIEKSRLFGNEQFHSNGVPITDWQDPTVRDFWSWSASDLLDNTTRGFLGEHLVAKALGNRVRERTEPWANWDLVTHDDIKIEVKTTGRRQSWHRNSPSKPTTPRWDIAPKKKWVDGKGWDDLKRRWADIYVFALHNEKCIKRCDAKDVTQWRFYVVSRGDLESLDSDQLPDNKQKSIGQTALGQLSEKHRASRIKFHELKAAILRAAKAE